MHLLKTVEIYCKSRSWKFALSATVVDRNSIRSTTSLQEGNRCSRGTRKKPLASLLRITQTRLLSWSLIAWLLLFVPPFRSSHAQVITAYAVARRLGHCLQRNAMTTTWRGRASRKDAIEDSIERSEESVRVVAATAFQKS
jgi:hypothetical protein